MADYITDEAGKWLVQGKARLLVEPSQDWLDARQAESEAAEQARVAAEAAEKAGLEALAKPLVDRVEAVLEARGLSVLAVEERTAMRDATVYLSSRGKHGRGGVSMS